MDPAVDPASERGWRRWLRRLLAREPERLAWFSGAVALGFISSILLLYAFARVASDVLESETTTMDVRAAEFAHTFQSPQMDVIARLVSLFGSEVVLVLAGLLVAVWIFQRRWGAAATLVLVAGGAQLLNDLLKQAFHRTRPLPVVGFITAQQFSFPSGHAMMSAAFYAFLAYLAWRLLRGPWRIVAVVALTLLVLAIGFARIYLQAHFLSDVIAGYLAGLLWTDTLVFASRLLVMRRRPREQTQTRTVRA